MKDAEAPTAFQEAYFKVFKPGAGMVPFKAYKYQKAIANDEAELVIINKSRQTGISVCTVLDMIHRAAIRDNYLCVFISLRQDQSNELITKAKLMISSMREPWKIDLIKKQQSRIQFTNGSRLIAVSAHESAGRSYSGDLVLDEFAHVPNDVQILQAALQITVREGWKIRMLSTPYGDRGEFARIVKGIKTGEITNWSLHEVHWSECPDLTYERIMERCFSEEMYQQEYNLQFLDEATSMLSWETLMRATDLQLDQWNLQFAPKSHNAIFIGVDPGEKINETGLVIVERIGDKWFVRHVFAKKMDPKACVKLVQQWIKLVKPVRVYVDETGMGVAVTSDLYQLYGKTFIQGVNMSNPMKAKLVYNMVGMFEDVRVAIPDNEKLKVQLHALEREYTPLQGLEAFTGKVKGKQDDLIWATALALSYRMFVSGTGGVQLKKYQRRPVRRKIYHGH